MDRKYTYIQDKSRKFRYTGQNDNDYYAQQYTSATNFKVGYAIVQNLTDSVFLIIDEYFRVTDTVPGYYNSSTNLSSWSEMSEFIGSTSRIRHTKFDYENILAEEKYGFANLIGEIIIPVKYDYAMGFYNGIAVVCLNDDWGYINASGVQLNSHKYDDANPFYEKTTTAKEKNGNWLLIDINFREKSSARFSAAGITSSGLTAVIPKGSTDNLYGFVNNNGEMVIKPQFHSTSYAKDGYIDAMFIGNLAYVELSEETVAYINTKGEIVWEGLLPNLSRVETRAKMEINSNVRKKYMNPKWAVKDKIYKKVNSLL